jgi:aryl-alcohol dehydrogenase-like predicted oxidoreductase
LRELQSIAESKGCSVAQLALAWILHQGDFFVPIPGTSKILHLETNAAAADIQLASTELAAIERIFPREGGVSGARHAYDRSKELNI